MEITSYQPGTPAWVDLGTPDPAAAGEFYGTLFGWTLTDADPESGGYRMCLLRGQPVAGLGQQQQSGMPPWWTTYVSVADADATAKAVLAAGGQVLVEPMDVLTAGRMAVFADNVGAAFSVWQPREHIGASLVGEPGTLCWNELTTRDPDAAVAFYPAVFGWHADAQRIGPVTYTAWQLDDKPIGGMMPMDQDWPPEVPAHWMVYFAVDDTDATAARAAELGGVVSVPPTDIEPGRFAVLNDPQGAVFSVIAVKPRD